jgi:hypothetical protein
MGSFVLIWTPKPYTIMNVDLFHIDYERLMEVLIAIVVLSFLLERAMSVLFEHRWFIRWAEGSGDQPKNRKGLKEIIASIACVAFCWWQDFDSVSIILQTSETPTFWGVVITGLMIAGGSKASIALFRDVLGFMSSAEKERTELNKVKREANTEASRVKIVKEAMLNIK